MVASLLLALILFLPEAQAAKSICANIWQQHAAEFEAYLVTAKIEKIAVIPIGVTKPQRAYLEPDGLIGSFAWKPIRPGMRDGYFESYKSEVAARSRAAGEQRTWRGHHVDRRCPVLGIGATAAKAGDVGLPAGAHEDVRRPDQQ